jgi:DNA-binding response OmpR family regulator
MSCGKTALIVEPEFLIALDLQRVLEASGFSETLFARSPAEARELSSQWPRLSLALVEFRLFGEETLALAAALHRHGVPTIGISSDVELTRGIDGLPAIPVLGKPVSDALLSAAVHRILGTPA